MIQKPDGWTWRSKRSAPSTFWLQNVRMSARHWDAEFRQQIHTQSLAFYRGAQARLAMTDQAQGQLENVGGRRRTVRPHPAAAMP